MHILHATDKDIHKEVDELMTKILDELPDEVILKQRKQTKRAWFKAIASLLCTIFVTMDEDESDKKFKKDLKH